MKQSDFYKNKAWRYLSKIVLLTYCDDNGEVSCATCGSKKHVRDKLMHCGHWIKSNNRSTALEFTNCAPQCYKCNIKYNGLPFVMKQWLISKYGQGAVDRLQFLKRKAVKLDYHELGEVYEKEFKELANKRGLNPWK